MQNTFLYSYVFMKYRLELAVDSVHVSFFLSGLQKQKPQHNIQLKTTVQRKKAIQGYLFWCQVEHPRKILILVNNGTGSGFMNERWTDGRSCQKPTPNTLYKFTKKIEGLGQIHNICIICQDEHCTACLLYGLLSNKSARNRSSGV